MDGASWQTGDQIVRILKSSGLMQGGTLTLPDGGTLETRYESSSSAVAGRAS